MLNIALLWLIDSLWGLGLGVGVGVGVGVEVGVGVAERYRDCDEVVEGDDGEEWIALWRWREEGH